MKKSTILIIISICTIFFLVAACIIGGIIFSISSIFTPREPITVMEFKTIMQSKGYNVYDAKNEFLYHAYIKNVYMAEAKDSSYKIEFYEFFDKEHADLFFKNRKSSIEDLKSKSLSQHTVNINNFSKYALELEEKYIVISRIDNTIIYVDTNAMNKENIKNILDEIGYK